MSVTCRRQDRQRFEHLGFVAELDEDKNTPVIGMVDAEANYGHYGEMPADIPYCASYGAGSNYGAGSIVCDGRDYEEVPGGGDGFVLDWNYRFGLPRLSSVLRIRRYLKIERRAHQLFQALREENHRKPAANGPCQ